MSDYISKQAAIDAIRGWVNKAFEDWGNAETEIRCFNAIYPLIMALPSAQPEIIRCKDCKHQVKEWRYDKRLKDIGYWVYGCKLISDVCGYWAWFGQDDEFCSEAERRRA